MRPSVSSHGRLTPPSHLALGVRIRGRATQAWGYPGTFKEGQHEATQAGGPVACLGMCWHLCCQQLAINWEPPPHVSSSRWVFHNPRSLPGSSASPGYLTQWLSLFLMKISSAPAPTRGSLSAPQQCPDLNVSNTAALPGETRSLSQQPPRPLFCDPEPL